MESQVNEFPNLHQQSQWIREENGVCEWGGLYEETIMLVQKSVGEAERDTSTMGHTHSSTKGKCIKN